MLSCVWLYVTLWTVGHRAPLSMGFSRQGYWSGWPCPPPGDLLGLGTEPESLESPVLAGRIFTTSATWAFQKQAKSHMLKQENTGTEQRDAENMKDAHTHVHTHTPHYTCRCTTCTGIHNIWIRVPGVFPTPVLRTREMWAVRRNTWQMVTSACTCLVQQEQTQDSNNVGTDICCPPQPNGHITALGLV